jgi:RNA polymerase sigma-70 factor (ECF subfamily)
VNDSRGLNRQEDERVDLPAGSMPRRTDIIEPLVARLAEQPVDRAAAFRSLVGASLDGAYRRAAVILGDRFEAEDAVHDAAEKAWRRWGDLRDPARFDAWFGRILVNTCRDRLRARRRVRSIEVGSGVGRGDDRAAASVAGGLGAVESAEQLRHTLEVLGPDERIAVVLRYEADLTVPAIAALLGIAEGTVKSRLHRALRALRASIERNDR